MLSKGKLISVFHLKRVFDLQLGEKLADHLKCLRVADDHALRILFGKRRDGSRVVRFHVLDNQVVRRRVFQDRCDILKPFLRLALVNRVHDRCLLVTDDVRVVRHSKRHIEMPFKKVNIVIIRADINNAVCYTCIHRIFPSF